MLTRVQLSHLSSSRLPTNGGTGKHFVTFGYLICRALVQTLPLHNPVIPFLGVGLPFASVPCNLHWPWIIGTWSASCSCPFASLEQTPDIPVTGPSWYQNSYTGEEVINPCPGSKLTHGVRCFQMFHRLQPRVTFAFISMLLTSFKLFSFFRIGNFWLSCSYKAHRN